MFHRLIAAAATLIALSLPGFASTGAVLIIANEDYTTLRDASGAAGVLSTVRRFEDMGFHVDMATDLSANAMRAALSSLSEALTNGDYERVVIVYAGRTVHAAHGTWLVGTDARIPDFATIESYGVRLETVLALAGARQGGALVAIADYGFPPPAATGFQPGLAADVDVPQGVTLVRGSGPGITDYLASIAQPGANLGAMAGRRADLALQGFNPPFLTFLPADHQPAHDADREAWRAALDAGTIAAFQAYLAAWPQGDYAAQAQESLAQLMNTPERVEEALGLTRDERRAIQRDLTILGYDPRGIDGIFGGGTRAAISAWQGANRFDATGYLNRDQIFEMAQQGARRAAQLEAEARARAQEEERRDRAYWRDTGSGQDEAGLRAYLDRYPSGIFANIARDRLAQIEADRRAAAQAAERAIWNDAIRVNTLEGYTAYLNRYPSGIYASEARRRIARIEEDRRAEAEAAERAAWAQAQAADTVAAYRAYLDRYPRGRFAEQARARIDELNAPPPRDDDREAARLVEEAMNLPQITRVLVERRLARLNFDPGAVDGTFDRDTRRAIRQWQRANGFPVTGYLDQNSLVRLTAGGMLDILH